MKCDNGSTLICSRLTVCCVLKLSFVCSNTWLTHTLPCSAHFHMPRLHACVYCDFVWHTDMVTFLLVPASHLPQRLPLKLSVHTLWLSQWKIRMWHPCISVSSAWHSESGHQRRWTSGEWGGRWQHSQRLADGRVSSWDHVLLHPPTHI